MSTNGSTASAMRRHRGIREFTSLLAVTLAAGFSVVAIPGALPAEGVACLVVPSGIEAWWPGNNSADEVVHNRDGIAQGATYGPGKVGQAFVFDGVDDVVTVADDPAWSLGSNDFSQSMWTRLNTVDHTTTFVSHDTSPGYSYSPKWWFVLDSSTLYFYIYGSHGWEPVISTPWSPTTLTWYHLAVTREGDTWRLFIDATKAAETTNDVVLPEISAPIRLGGEWQSGIALDGKLDEVTFFHRALSPDEVTAIFEAGAYGLCPPISSSATLTANRTTMLPGQSVSLTGALDLAGGLSAAGREVTLYRKVNDRTKSQIAVLTTGSAGEFSFTQKPPEGTVRYEVWFEGADNAVPAVARVTVKVAKGVSDLTLSASTRRLVYGKSVIVTAHLKGGSTNRTVSIYAKPVGETKRLVRRDRVSASGYLKFRATPRVNTSYTAVYKGDTSWLPDTSRTVQIDVKAFWRSGAVGEYAKSGKYNLFHYRTSCGDRHPEDCPYGFWKLIPQHPGASVTLTSQRWHDGAWHQSRISFHLYEHSNLSIYYHYVNTTIIGERHRWRLTWKGDADHIGTTSPWLYWKVTR